MYVDSGNRYFQKQQFREASLQYQNAIQIDSAYSDAHYRLAKSYLSLGYWSDAYRELSRTVDLAPENLQAQIDFGNMQLAARQFQEAQHRAETVLQKDPNNVDAHILRANAFAQLQDIDASLKEMQTAIGLNPQLGRSYLDLGVLQSSAKQADAASTRNNSAGH
jgi:Tfp pilus assembly protein PilF